MDPKISPVFLKQLDALFEEVLRALALSEVRAKVDHLASIINSVGGVEASEKIPDVAVQVEGGLDEIVSLVRESSPQVMNYLSEPALKNVVLSQIAGEWQASLEFRQLPGIESPNPYFVRDDQDVEWLRQKIQPGQVWVNATALNVRTYRDLWGAISFQLQAGVGLVHLPAGRPPGRLTKLRRELKQLVRKHPEWTDKEIFRAGVQAGLWEREPYEDNPERNRARVKRLKK